MWKFLTATFKLQIVNFKRNIIPNLKSFKNLNHCRFKKSMAWFNKWWLNNYMSKETRLN